MASTGHHQHNVQVPGGPIPAKDKVLETGAGLIQVLDYTPTMNKSNSY